MKRKLLAIALLLVSITSINAQIIRADELEEYAKEKYGKKWIVAAENLGKELSLDKNNALTYVQVVEAPGKTKNQLYVLLNYWFTSTFGSGESVIELNDKETGIIIAKGVVEGVAVHSGGMNTYKVNLTPIIKTDIKDEKIRITYSIPYYSVTVIAGGGIIGASLWGGVPKRVNENWLLDKCFPFAEEDEHEKTSSKALVMAHAYSNVIMDKIEEAVKNGMIGNEDDDW